MKIKAFILAGLVSLPLSGCVTFEQIENNIQTEFVGKPLSHAITSLGYPSEEKVIAGHKLYVWNTQHSGSYTIPTSNTSTAYVGLTPITVHTTEQETVSYNYYCHLTLEVDKKNIVIDYEVDGNIGGCERYAD